MLYSKQQIVTFNNAEHNIAIGRYITKLLKQETQKLLPHECGFLCSCLPYIFKEEQFDQPAYDIYNLTFLREALLKRLILLYLDNLDFLSPVYNGHKNLSKQEIEIDKSKFKELIEDWERNLINGSNNIYLHEVKIEYHRKLKILYSQFSQGYLGRHFYNRKILEQKTAAFYIYFIVKAFFKNNKKNWVSLQFAGHTFVINVYSYVHILSRHYMPKFHGIDAEKSFNRELVGIDIFDLPNSLSNLITDYFANAPKGYFLNSEFLIFSQGTEYYIIWWKLKNLNELKFSMGYEIRTLYLIKSKSDYQKINKHNSVSVNNGIIYYY
ncbi:MAG: hypothetical protein EOP46_00090 [Sphingobacteriaceae bacterium]|nr:MAG: hypothetical protein EOP46_00090 [Sphingobacteriaceae bacterium]